MISKEKHTNRFMPAISFITAVVILFTTFFAGNVLAANTQDRLESWTKNEIYYRDGIQFSVNVSGKSVPDWVFEDVAGKDGKIDVVIKRVQTRDVKGEVGDYAILELKGAKGTTRLSNLSGGGFDKISIIQYNSAAERIPELLNEAYTSDYSFCEFNNPGYEGYRNSPVASLVTENSGKRKYVNVDFAFRGNETLSAVYVDFLTANGFDNVEDLEKQKYKPVKADSGSIEFIGNFEKDYVFWAKETPYPRYFTYFEKDFVNKKVAGIDIAVDSANTEGITLKAAVSHPMVSSYEIYVFNQNEREISYNWDKKAPEGYLTLKPARTRNRNTGVYKDIPENQILRGETYRVDIVLFDKEHKVIYRQREHVKIP